MMDPEAKPTALCHADYYTMAGIAMATCLALCPMVGLMGRRGGLLTFMIITALASLLQLGLLNCESSHKADSSSLDQCAEKKEERKTLQNKKFRLMNTMSRAWAFLRAFHVSLKHKL